MTEEGIVLKEYFDSLGLDEENLSKEDLIQLKNELKEAGELGLANWVGNLKDPNELLDYIGE
jgi:hypothetical protein